MSRMDKIQAKMAEIDSLYGAGTAESLIATYGERLERLEAELGRKPTLDEISLDLRMVMSRARQEDAMRDGLN